VHTFGDVSHSIPRIYAAMDNMQAYHQTSIIEMDGKLCDQVVSILIDLGSNYSYINPDLVVKCGDVYFSISYCTIALEDIEDS